MTDFDAQRNLEKELGRSERLLWAGRPRQGLMLRPSDAMMIPFSLMWGGFAIFWETAVITMGGPWFFMLWGIPFVLVGLYLIFGRFIHDAWVRSKTLYGVSNQRILIRYGGLSKRLTTLSLGTLHEVSVQEKTDRSGTLVLGPSGPTFQMSFQSRGSGTRAPPAFEGIQNVRNVLDIIHDAQKRLADT